MLPQIASPLKSKVETKLRENTLTSEFPIEVIDSNGVIILQGEVPYENVSMLAEGLARQVDGVVNVVNELAINRSSKKKTIVPPASGLSQAR